MKNRFLKTFIFSILLITTLFLGMASAWEIPGGWDNFNRALRVIPDGTVTAPAWAFKSEPSLGFYRSGSGVISVTGGILSALGGSYSLSDSDVAHGMTDVAATNIYGLLNALDAADAGGLRIQGLSDGNAIPLYLRGIIGTDNPNDLLEAISIVAAKKNGTGVQALGALETVLQILNNTTELVNITGSGQVLIGANANAKSTLGLTINQAANDDEILSLKSSDVGHTFTTNTEADTFFYGKKLSATLGGAGIWGLSDGDATGLQLTGAIGIADPTNTISAVVINGVKLSGTTYGAVGNDEIVAQVTNNGTALTTWLGNGNVGIGTTEPGARQDIRTSNDGVVGLVIGNSSVNPTGNLQEWQPGVYATAYINQYGASYFGAAGINVAPDASIAQFQVQSGDVDRVALKVFGHSGQNYNLQEWLNSAGTALTVIDNIGNVGIGTTTFGTSAAGILAMGVGTAPTTSPADAAQMWSADEGGRAGYAQLHTRNEAGQNGAIAFQAPLVNLLSNSGFGSWSNGTLENVGSQLVASWANVDYDTFTSTGADITSAIYTTAGTQDASSAAITLVSGKLYKIVVTLTLNSGQAPTLAMTNLGHTSAAISAGANTFVREATNTTTTLTVSNTAAANWSATFTLYEVTPATIAADGLAPDGWVKDSGLSLYREYNGSNTKAGSFFALKMVSASAKAVYFNTGSGTDANWLEKWRGKKVTIGTWAKSSVATKATVYIYTNTTTASAATVGTDYEWLEATLSIPSDATTVMFWIGNNTATSYISQPMLVFGPSIGAGNYAPPPNETIYTEKVIALTNYTATTSAADATINLEAQSSGMIPKGVKAVLVKAYGKDSAAGDGVGFDVQSASGVEDGLSIDTQVNNIRVQGQGWIKANSDGDIVLDHRGSGASALTLDIKVIAVQP